MSAATNYFENMCLNPLRGLPSTAPATVYVGLFLSDPGETGAGTEVTGGGYARQAVSFSAPAAVDGVVSMQNVAEVLFPKAVAAWGLVTHVAVLDSLTAGNMLHKLQLPTPKDIIIGTTVSFLAGELVLTASGLATNYWKTKCLNLLRGQSISAIANAYLGLFSSDPGNTGAGTEISATGYARQAIPFAVPAEQAGGDMMTSNTAPVIFERAPVAWGSVGWGGIMDAGTSGNMLYRFACNPVVTISVADRWTAEVGAIKVTAN